MRGSCSTENAGDGHWCSSSRRRGPVVDDGLQYHVLWTGRLLVLLGLDLGHRQQLGVTDTMAPW